MTKQEKRAARAMGATVAAKVNDAYMTDSYGEREWERCACWLAEQGLDAAEIEAVLRSKYMRWAEEGGCCLANFKKFWAQSPTLTTKAAIDELVAGTF